MASTQAFALRRSNHQTELIRDFSHMLEDEDLTDVTLSCEDGIVQAHRLFLSANSPYFKSIFSRLSASANRQYPVIVLKDITVSDMRAIIEFIYRGEVTVPQAQLPSVLKAADGLKIRGLNGMENIPTSDGLPSLLPSKKRKKKRRRKSKGSGASDAGGSSDEGAHLDGDSGNEGLSSEDDDDDHRTQITPISDGASTAEDLEPSRLLEQSMTVTGDGSDNGARFTSPGITSNSNDHVGLISHIDTLNESLGHNGHTGLLGFDAHLPSIAGPSSLARTPGYLSSGVAAVAAAFGARAALAGLPGHHQLLQSVQLDSAAIQMFKSLRGADILSHGGYIYYHYLTRIRPQNNQSVFYWRCDLQSHKDYKCPGRCSTIFTFHGQQMFETRPVGHNHPPDQARCDAKKQRSPPFGGRPGGGPGIGGTKRKIQPMSIVNIP